MKTDPVLPLPLPTWTRSLPAFLAVVESGSSFGRRFAVDEMERMAAVADASVELSELIVLMAQHFGLPIHSDDAAGLSARVQAILVKMGQLCHTHVRT